MAKRTAWPGSGKRTFGGRLYTIHDRSTNKWAADRIAKRLRKQGFLARVTGSGTSYIVWFTTK